MSWKSLTTFTAALLFLGFIGMAGSDSAHAVIGFDIDTFDSTSSATALNDGNGDATCIGGTCEATDGGIVLNAADSNLDDCGSCGAVTRTLAVDITDDDNQSAGAADADIRVADSQLKISDVSGTTATFDVTWEFTAQDFDQFSALQIEIETLSADLSGATIELRLEDGTTFYVESTSIEVGASTIIFDIADYDPALNLATIDLIRLSFVGVEAFDGRFTIIGISQQVPEPATLGLFGIGLAALGLLYRRRRPVIRN